MKKEERIILTPLPLHKNIATNLATKREERKILPKYVKTDGVRQKIPGEKAIIRLVLKKGVEFLGI